MGLAGVNRQVNAVENWLWIFVLVSGNNLGVQVLDLESAHIIFVYLSLCRVSQARTKGRWRKALLQPWLRVLRGYFPEGCA